MPSGIRDFPVLVEAARIARGNIKALTEADAAEFDALVVPGGFGAAKNLSDFAVAGAAMVVQSDFLTFARAFHAAGQAHWSDLHRAGDGSRYLWGGHTLHRRQ